MGVINAPKVQRRKNEQAMYRHTPNQKPNRRGRRLQLVLMRQPPSYLSKLVGGGGPAGGPGGGGFLPGVGGGLAGGQGGVQAAREGRGG